MTDDRQLLMPSARRIAEQYEGVACLVCAEDYESYCDEHIGSRHYRLHGVMDHITAACQHSHRFTVKAPA